MSASTVFYLVYDALCVGVLMPYFFLIFCKSLSSKSGLSKYLRILGKKDNIEVEC